MELDLTKALGLSLGRNMAREYTQDFVPVENVQDGVLIVNDGTEKKFVKILEIEASNFDFRDYEDQNAIVRKFGRWLKIAPDSFQIKAVSRRTDISSYIKASEENYKSEPSPACRSMISHYIEHVYAEASMESAAFMRYFLIFHYRDSSFSFFNTKLNII